MTTLTRPVICTPPPACYLANFIKSRRATKVKSRARYLFVVCFLVAIQRILDAGKHGEGKNCLTSSARWTLTNFGKKSPRTRESVSNRGISRTSYTRTRNSRWSCQRSDVPSKVLARSVKHDKFVILSFAETLGRIIAPRRVTAPRERSPVTWGFISKLWGPPQMNRAPKMKKILGLVAIAATACVLPQIASAQTHSQYPNSPAQEGQITSKSAKMTDNQANSGTAERPEQRQMVAKSAEMGGTGPSVTVGKETVPGRSNGMVTMLKQDEKQDAQLNWGA